ncbi:MAG: hypothetical protein K2I77_06880 [Anaeroplasmataceae bacterium]|nr:hypothetical protein [Anaeroplasmataceae bacterium]
MKILGLIVAVIIFASLLILWINYSVSVFLKKYQLADRLFKFLILHGFISFMLLSWSIILTIQSYDIFSVTLNNTLIGIIVIFFVLFIGVVDAILYANMKKEYSSAFSKLIRRMGTISVMIWLSIDSFLFYLEIYHFYILSLLA